MKTYKFVHYDNEIFLKEGGVKGKLIKTSDSVVLDDILQDFEDFLRGCGFSIKGHLDVVNEESEDSNGEA